MVRQKLGTQFVEPHMEAQIIQSNQSLNDLFMQAKVTFSVGEKTVIVCKSLNAFAEKIVLHRGLDHPFFRFNIDGGQNSLKMSMSVLEEQEYQAECSTSKSRDSLNTSVKKIFIVVLAGSVPENYENVREMLSLINFETFQYQYTFVNDMKINSILAGISSNASLHPCIYCTFIRGSRAPGLPRTFQNIEDSYNSWIANGGKDADLKKYDNTKFPPLIQRGSQNQTINMLAPSQLHIFLGVVNLLFDDFAKVSPIAEKWRSSLGVIKDPYFGEMFNGNSCHILVKNTEKIIALCRTRIEVSTCKPFQQALFHFGRLMSFLCKQTESSTLHTELTNFISAFDSTGCRVTNKVHVVLHHLVPFYEASKFNLSVLTEQSHESLHKDFERIWSQNKVKDESKEQYGTKLLHCVCRYNISHF
jgi:hypothetical protein